MRYMYLTLLTLLINRQFKMIKFYYYTYFIFVYLHLLSFASEISEKTKGCVYCRPDHAGVFLSPYVSGEDIGDLNRYNVSDLLPFVEKVSSEFRIVAIIPSSRPDTSLYWVPNAVASWNSDVSQSTTDHTIEAIIIVYSSFPPPFGPFLLRDIMRNANSIHPNSVTTFIHICDAEELTSDSFHYKFLYLRLTFLREEFKLGVVFDAKDFQVEFGKGSKIFANNIKNNFGMLDSVYFIIDSDEVGLDSAVEQIVERKMNLVKDLFQFVQRNIFENHTLSYGVIGSWPDTNGEGQVNYTRLVTFWKSMISYGKSNNIIVLINEAFDNPNRGTPQANSYGWWRLVENSSVSATSDYVFQTKLELANMQKEQTSEWYISQLEKDITFNRNNIIALFEPHPSLFYTETIKKPSNVAATLPIFLEQIATKFSKLIVQNGPGFLLETNKLAPNLVAKHNLKSPSSPLELIFVLDMRQNTESEVDQLIQKVLHTNEISPKTIQQVVLHPNNDSDSTIAVIRNRLNPNSSNPPIQVGYQFSLQYCAGTKDKFYYPNALVKLGAADFIHFVNIIGWPTQAGYKYGIDRVLPQVINRFESCKRRVAKEVPGKSVFFVTGYENKHDSGNANYTSLVIFWREMNSWAERTNTKVIMYQTFDSLDVQSDRASASGMGWWRVKHGKGNDLIFEEKRVVALNILQEAVRNKAKTQETWPLAITLPVSVVLLSTAILAIIYVFMKLRERKNKQKICSLYSSTMELIAREPETTNLIESSDFVVENSIEIGKGNFGTVYKTYMPKYQTDVAVKIASRPDNGNEYYDPELAVKSLLSEIKIMSQIGNHENILRLLGVCFKKNLFMVTEYCKHGSLLSYLRSNASEDFKLPIYELLQFCTGVSNGMKYLEERKVIHGDLSARNVLLDEYKICKVSDFGLSRKLELYDKYMKKGEEPLPWRWMAIESLMRLEFSSKSDVWSMGVTFWEVFTLGKIPYPEMTGEGTSFCDRLVDGLRLGKPETANNQVYNLMLSCWEKESTNRPSANEITNLLGGLKTSEYINV